MPVNVPVVPDTAPVDTNEPTSTCPVKSAPVPPVMSPALIVSVPSVKLPPVTKPLALIVVAPVIAPAICKLLPPTIVVPTLSASPTNVFFLITAPPSVLKDVV